MQQSNPNIFSENGNPSQRTRGAGSNKGSVARRSICLSFLCRCLLPGTGSEDLPKKAELSGGKRYSSSSVPSAVNWRRYTLPLAIRTFLQSPISPITSAPRRFHSLLMLPELFMSKQRYSLPRKRWTRPHRKAKVFAHRARKKAQELR